MNFFRQFKNIFSATIMKMKFFEKTSFLNIVQTSKN